MAEVQLKRKVSLRRKGEEAVFTFDGRLKVRLLWQSSTDLDLCLFFKRKDGEVGGVFSNLFRQNKKDLGSLTEAPFIQHTGDAPEPAQGGESVEQVNVASLNDIEEVYICVLNYSKAIDGETVRFSTDSGRIELASDSGDYLEVPIDADQEGHLYHVCTIKKQGESNALINERAVLDLGTAFDKIPGFALICE